MFGSLSFCFWLDKLLLLSSLNTSFLITNKGLYFFISAYLSYIISILLVLRRSIYSFCLSAESDEDSNFKEETLLLSSLIPSFYSFKLLGALLISSLYYLVEKFLPIFVPLSLERCSWFVLKSYKLAWTLSLRSSSPLLSLFTALF